MFGLLIFSYLDFGLGLPVIKTIDELLRICRLLDLRSSEHLNNGLFILL